MQRRNRKQTDAERGEEQSKEEMGGTGWTRGLNAPQEEPAYGDRRKEAPAENPQN